MDRSSDPMATTDWSTVTLHSGRRIVLRELRQRMTYEGLLEGFPTRRLNEAHIERLVEEYRRSPGFGAPHVIRPIETPVDISHLPGPVRMLYARKQGMIPASIPAITCIGRFESFEPVRTEHGDASRLVVIWFQAAWALPIAPDVLAKLAAIDWDAHAKDFWW